MAREPRGVTTDRIVSRLREGRALILTGERGIGKSWLVESIGAGLSPRPIATILGNPAGRNIPYGAFASLSSLTPDSRTSPAALLDHLQQWSAILVDDVSDLDEESLHIIVRLVSTRAVPGVVVSRSVAEAPVAIRRLYDGGFLIEESLQPLTDTEASELVCDLLGGPVTPRTLAWLLSCGQGHPFYVRELVRGSRLTPTEHGWELDGSPRPSPRLSHIIAERFADIHDSVLDSLTMIALAGRAPAAILPDIDLLARRGIVTATVDDWVAISRDIDAMYFRDRCPQALRLRLVQRTIDMLRRVHGPRRSEAELRASRLALDHGIPLESDALLSLAAYALCHSEEKLAQRAALAALHAHPDSSPAHRYAGLAASALGEDAEELLRAAIAFARTDEERAAGAVAHAHHVGESDAMAAIAAIDQGLAEVQEPELRAFLSRARLRWTAVAGQPFDVPLSDDVDDPAALIFDAMAGVISGPLSLTRTLLPRLREIPVHALVNVPSGGMLIDLADIMAISNDGDVNCARARLEDHLRHATDSAPEARGTWEFTLGFLELLSGDPGQAWDLARSAVFHLQWRDGAGLLVASRAMLAAAAAALGRPLSAESEFPGPIIDPKAMMLRRWANARAEFCAHREDRAASDLVSAASELLAQQHTYLAGMLAHCAVRIGRRVDEGKDIIDLAAQRAGGGLLTFLSRHADATAARDLAALEELARDAEDCGMYSTAIDAWLTLADWAKQERPSVHRAARFSIAADEVRSRIPRAVLWSVRPDHPPVLTERESRVARLAADRLTTREIAQIHDVSVNTVANQLSSVFRKLGVTSRAELRDVLIHDPAAQRRLGATWRAPTSNRHEP